MRASRKEERGEKTKRIMVVHNTIKTSQDGRHEARVFALAMGVLFGIICAAPITF
jgi:hypothetical protein